MSNKILGEVNNKIEALDRKINSRITKVESKHTETIQKLFKTWDERNLETKKLILDMCDGDSSIQAPSVSSEEESTTP